MTTAAETPEPATRNAAPKRLELVREFVNTFDVEENAEGLSDPAALHAWLSEKRLLRRHETVTEADRERAIELREALRDILLGHTEGKTTPATVRRFDAVVSRIPMRLRVDDTGWVRVAAAGGGFDAAQAELLERVYEAMEDGSWQRLKVCGDGTCRWAFFDHSKNHSGHWCNMAVCGNRAKVHAYRQRQAGGAGHGKAPDKQVKIRKEA